MAREGKPMVCVDCMMRLNAPTVGHAKKHGWEFWVGGGRCRLCVEDAKRRAEFKARGACSKCGLTMIELESIETGVCSPCRRLQSPLDDAQTTGRRG